MNKNLETLFRRYQQRLMHIDLRAYLLLQMFISFGYIIMILVLNIVSHILQLTDIHSVTKKCFKHSYMKSFTA